MAIGPPTTAQILAEKALERTCGGNCVDWAIAMLVAGHDGERLSMLAGMMPPYNHFEIAAMRDRALHELGLSTPPLAQAVTDFAAELLRRTMGDDAELRNAVRDVSDLCVASDYRRDLFDFYLLDSAFDDVESGHYSYHWEGATSANIMELVRKRVTEFLTSISAADKHARAATGEPA